MPCPGQAPKSPKTGPLAPRPGRVTHVTTLRHIDALLGTSWAWDVDDDENLTTEDLRAEVDAMLDELVFDSLSGDLATA